MVTALGLSQDLGQGEQHGQLAGQMLIVMNQREDVVKSEGGALKRHSAVRLLDVVVVDDISMRQSKLDREAGVGGEGSSHQEVPRFLAV